MERTPSLATTPSLFLALRAVRTRRLVAAGLLGVSVLCGLDALHPVASPTRVVWIAARDLPGGEPLVTGDLKTERLPIADVPRSALGSAAPWLGQMMAGPVRVGEPITDVRLLSPALLSASGHSGDVAVPIRVADGPAALALAHAGERIDVLAGADPAAAAATKPAVVVTDVLVLATPSTDVTDPTIGSAGSGADEAGLVVVAASRQQAEALAGVGSTRPLTIAVRGAPTP